MKIIQSIEAIYEEQKELNLLLQSKVDEIFTRLKLKSWHYFSRIKQLESFALKLETGRFSEAKSMEDFFACTIVVENLDQINKATELIRESFNIFLTRPKDQKLTHKEPSSFQFDDLRLYATLIQKDFLPEEPINKVKFEIQVKTFLQHAWSLATHDLIYKSNEINWSKERIAYQIKAMLEQAELTISGVNNLITVPEVLKDNYETTQQKKILNFYNNFFKSEDLPKDVVRLCKNTQELLKGLNLQVEDLEKVLQKENDLGKGVHFKNLSPFLLILQSIINQRQNLVQKYIEKDGKQKFKIILPKELDISSIKLLSEVNVIRI